MRSKPSRAPWLASIVVLSTCFGPGAIAAPLAAPEDGESSNKYRLGSDVVPSSYTLKVIPEKAAGTFSGEEQIDIELKTKQSTIVLNAVDLQISDCSIQSEDKQSTTLEVSTLAPSEQVKLVPKNVLGPGKYKLSLKFSGALNKHLRGLYGATANLENKKEVALVATQFEPTDARRMFPCFDEPAFKATFNVAAVIDADDTAISNAPIDSEKQLNDKQKLITFSESPKMSTYLLALFVGPFKANEAVESDGVKVRVWSIGHPVAMGDYARDFAAKLLPFFHQYFGLAYPGQKLDLVALPDFEAGAMENLGAISFRETLLLRDDTKDSLEAKMSLASVVAHEMSHMWFGDLVTMKWWDDLWLNEAFATWMSHKAIAFAYPNWQTWEHLASAKNGSMQTDALASSRAIHADVKNPADAFQMFDEITYSKGASIIRMLELYVGEDEFRAGVGDYLKSHRFANASTDDLWTAIEQTSRKPINSVMHNWVYQPGFPLVSEARKDLGTTQVSQSRFLANPDAKPSVAVWQVPIGLRAAISEKEFAAHDRKTDYFLLTESSISKSMAMVPPGFLNARGAGYYRSHYSSGVPGEISFNNLDTIERFTLLTDEWALARANKVSIGDYLTLLATFKEEQEPFILTTVCEQFEELWNLTAPETFDGTIYRDDFLSRFIRETLLPAKTRFGWQEKPSDSDAVKTARSAILRTIGTIGQDADTINEGRAYFREYLDSSEAKKPFAFSRLLGPIESILAYNGGSLDYSRLKEVWLRLADTPSGSKRALFCLSRFRDKNLIEKTLALTLSNEVKIQDSPALLASILSQKDGRRPALIFLENNWETIQMKYPPYMLPGIISAAKTTVSHLLQRDFVQFFQGHLPPECNQSFERTVEQITNNVKYWLNSNNPTSTWLKMHFENRSMKKIEEGKNSDAHI